MYKAIETSANHWRRYVARIILMHFILICLVGLSRHWGFMTSINDNGVFDQAVWGTLHGKLLLNTSQFNQPINWMGFHFQPILFLFVPFYVLIPSIIWFIMAQAFALSISAWPIFLLASRVCQSEKTGLIWALAYLMNPYLLNAAVWDFHPITLAVPFVAICMLSIEVKNFRALLLSCLVILSCKEHLGIMVIGFGLLWWIHNKRWKTAVSLIFIGIAHCILVLDIVMPAFSPSGGHLMLSKGMGQLSRYSWLGGSMKEVFQTLLFNPISVIKIVLVEMNGVRYLLMLMTFFLGLPLVAPEFLLPGLADLASNTLSDNPMSRAFFAYHSASLIPVLSVAAIYGTKRISRWSKKFSMIGFSGVVLIASFVGGYLLAPLPLPGSRNVWKPVHFFNLPDPTVSTIRSIIGEETSISAQANIGAHFSQRREIYRFPNKVGEVDVIILRLESPTTNVNNIPDQIKRRRKYLIGTLDSHLQMDRTEYITSIEHLMLSKEYEVIFWNDSWLVFKRGHANHIAYKRIEQKLSQLRMEWKINIKK